VELDSAYRLKQVDLLVAMVVPVDPDRRIWLGSGPTWSKLTKPETDHQLIA